MYNLINLGLVIGTIIGFPLWCGLVLALFTALAYRHSRRLRNETIRLVANVALLLKRPLLSNITGNQGFPIQLEIFEQNLTTRIQMLFFKFRNLFKIHR